jgi:hypothetical protein
MVFREQPLGISSGRHSTLCSARGIPVLSVEDSKALKQARLCHASYTLHTASGQPPPQFTLKASASVLKAPLLPRALRRAPPSITGLTAEPSTASAARTAASREAAVSQHGGARGGKGAGA